MLTTYLGWSAIALVVGLILIGVSLLIAHLFFRTFGLSAILLILGYILAAAGSIGVTIFGIVWIVTWFVPAVNLPGFLQ